MELRPYQTRAIADVRAAFAKGSRSVCLVAPTGSGKTVIASEMIRGAVAKGNRSLFLVHRIELVDQAVSRLAAFGVDAGVIAAGRDPSESMAQVASIQTLIRRDFPEARFVFVDECHHAAANTYREVLSAYEDAWIVGLTATPCRLDGLPLDDVFDTLVLAPSTRDLCNAGVLVEPRTYSHPDQPDLSGLKIRAGDYEQEELARRVIDSKLVGSIVDFWADRAGNARTVAYAVNVEHSKMIVDAFVSAGIAAEHLDGSTPSRARAEILARLRTGETRIVCNCMILTEGYDLPELEVAILARPTASFALYRQMVGRIMRPGKERALVLDHAGNAKVHGIVTEDVVWSLEGKAKRKNATPYKTCPKCFAIVDVGESECPECGASFTRETPKVLRVAGSGELVEVGPIDRQKWYREQVEIASAQGYKLGWARRRYKDRFGVWPRKVTEMERASYVCRAHFPEQTEFGPRCGRCLRT